MPRYDGTGPQGFGPMTGRGMGFCGINARNVRRFAKWAPMGFAVWTGVRRFAGWRRRRGAGRGLGFGRIFGPR